MEGASRPLATQPVAQKTVCVKNKELGVGDEELGLRSLRNS